jgi:hypothetical protein
MTKAHTTVTQDALKTFLAQIQVIWDWGFGRAHLAPASGHAAEAA